MSLLVSDIITVHPLQFSIMVVVCIFLICNFWLEEGEKDFNRGIKEVEVDE